MRRLIIGLFIGACAGVIDVAPMISMGLTWDANCSAFALWVVSGLLIATTELKLRPILKGIIIPLLVLFPSAFLIGWNNPVHLLPILIMTILLGAISGTVIHRFTRSAEQKKT